MSHKKNIGLFMSDLENEFSFAVLEGAIEGAKEQDANLIVFPMGIINATYSDPEVTKYRYQYNMLASYMNAEILDGIIIEYGTIVSSISDDIKRVFLSFIKDKPTILLSEEAEGFSSIAVDNEYGLKEVIEHLITDHKYTKIGYLSGTVGNCDAENRLKVFKEVMKAHDLYKGDDWIAFGNFSCYIEKEVIELYNRHPDMEVLVCANDSMALGAKDAFESLGLKVGRDIFITGFDDIVAGYLMDPMLTTVRATPSELSFKAVDVLCNSYSASKRISINTKMIKRMSCGCDYNNAEDRWRKVLGIASDWRTTAQTKFNEASLRRLLERELGTITRELVFGQDSEQSRYNSILNSLRRIGFTSANLYLYDNIIYNTSDNIWKIPDHINLVGYYLNDKSGKNITYRNKEYRISLENIFDSYLDDNLHNVVTFPLFFGERQMGILICESDANKFVYAQDMAGQISSTLHILSMYEEQQKMSEALEEASKSKSQFLANMSHEIRTPINAIIGFNEMILRENQDTSTLEYANDVKSAADALLLLVNDVLDFSKIEAGKMELIPSEYTPYNLFNGVINMMNSRAEKKGLALFLDYDDSIPEQLYGDSGRIQQILINLVSNAIKYTEKGTVTVSVSGKTKTSDFLLSVKVKDTGVGIKKKDIKRLFNEFDRIDEKRNRNIEGTGLGINITTGLLNLMGSKLLVESEYGLGSVFSFEISQKIIDVKNDDSSSEDATLNRPFIAPSVKILIVDDNSLNRKVILSLLKNNQMIIDQAESGFACIDMVSDNTYDLILLDHMMPEMDGIETFEKMISMNIIDVNRTRVVALTANAIAGAKEKFLESGFSDYLTKPVLPADLNKMLLRNINEDKVIFV